MLDTDGWRRFVAEWVDRGAKRVFASREQRRRRAAMKRIDVDRAQQLIKRGAVLVDVLPASVYIEEHLPGAINVPLETMDRQAMGDIEQNRTIVVYCFDQH